MGRLLLVSNRLPFTTVERGGEQWLRPSDGGLATVLRRVHARANSLWFGSVPADQQTTFADQTLNNGLSSIRLRLIRLARHELEGFYRGYSNEVLWPALHGLSPLATPETWWWEAYRSVTREFADAVASDWRPGDVIWVHDYHLMLLPRMLRDRIPAARIAFFLHTPLPAPCELRRLGEWSDLVDGILGADVAAFQTAGDAGNFADIVGKRWRPERLETGGFDHRTTRIDHCPIAIDHAWFAERSHHPSVLNQRAGFRAEADGPLFVGIDRLDLTKGIPARLQAFERLLRFEPQLRGHARFIQIGIPSREEARGYRELQSRVSELVHRINADYATPTWTPIDYRVGSIDPMTLVALYCAADVMVVTSIRDGMNLVAKEFVASRTDGSGALVLSRTAGAVDELRAAVKVDASDVLSIMNGYRRALLLSAGEKRVRMRKLRAAVRARSTLAWAAQCLDPLGPGDDVLRNAEYPDAIRLPSRSEWSRASDNRPDQPIQARARAGSSR